MGKLYLWKINKGKVQPCELLRENSILHHSSEVSFIVFADEDNYLITGSGDQKVRVWELNQSSDTLITKRALEIDTRSWVSNLALKSYSGQPKLAVTGTDATTKIFSLSEDHIVKDILEKICPEFIERIRKESEPANEINEIVKFLNSAIPIEIDCPILQRVIKRFNSI